MQTVATAPADIPAKAWSRAAEGKKDGGLDVHVDVPGVRVAEQDNEGDGDKFRADIEEDGTFVEGTVEFPEHDVETFETALISAIVLRRLWPGVFLRVDWEGIASCVGGNVGVISNMGISTLRHLVKGRL